LGPAVVAAGLDHVELVPSVLAELRSVHRPLLVPGDALRVPVAHAEYQRIVERDVLGNLAIGTHAQDLPGQRLPLLRAVAIVGVAAGGVEHPFGPVRQTAPLVESAGGQVVEYRLGLTQVQAPRLAEEGESFEPVLVTGGIEGIEFVVADGETVEAGLARRLDLVEAGDLAGITVGGDLEEAAGVALADQRRVPDEDDRPRSLE